MDNRTALLFQHARRSGHSPIVAMAYARGATLPAKSLSEYMRTVEEQQRMARVRRAVGRMRVPLAAEWRDCWHDVRFSLNVDMNPVPYDDPNMLPTYITTAGLD